MEKGGLCVSLWDLGDVGLSPAGTTPLSSGTEIHMVYRTFKMSDPIMSSHHPNYLMPSDTRLTLWSLYTYNYMPHFAKVEAR